MSPRLHFLSSAAPSSLPLGPSLLSAAAADAAPPPLPHPMPSHSAPIHTNETAAAPAALNFGASIESCIRPGAPPLPPRRGL
eukprot:8322703-Pyramimonas_sp.AAC.1